MKQLSLSTLALGLSASIFLAGCGNPLPSIDSLEGKKPPLSLQQAAREVFETRFLSYRGSHYTVVVYGDGDFTTMMSDYMERLQSDGLAEAVQAYEEPSAFLLRGMELVELKGLRTETSEHDLNEADRLNEVRWKGSISVTAEAQRRRTLDLTKVLEMAIKDPGVGVEIPWTERDLTWIAVESKADGDGNGETLAASGAFDFMGAMMEAIGGLGGDHFAASDWSDWSSAEDASFQYSEAELRGNQAILATNETVDVLDGKDTLFFRMPGEEGSTLNFMSALSGASDPTVFLLKPDLQQLRAAAVL